MELKNGYFYINNEKFFIRGIGYEVGAIPGQLPWEREFDGELLTFDMNRIQSAGFNTIRTWAPFTEEELQVISGFDIKIIMGIWIDPGGNFADPAFISSAKQEVYNVLSYSKNFQNIIAYIIMNEPLPETIFAAGYHNSELLWAQLIDIIHEEHPGVPVTIANTCNGTYINPETFDFSAYNVYPYNPSTVNFTHKYPAYIEYLKGLRSDDKPLVITEYGLSVSPTGPGNWGYGGNSLDEQTNGILFMFRSLIDGGAAGSCTFNYSDGWWKGGNEFVHDDNPEEWFGLVEYQYLSDKHGVPRPVWGALETYMRALVVSPKNHAIYINQVPIELFCEDTVRKVEAFKNNELVYTSDLSASYLSDSLDLTVTGKQDNQWHFVFYDQFNNVLKEEDITFLVSDSEIALPVIEINTNPEIIEEPGTIEASYNISPYSDFTHSENINYTFYQHIGWNYGLTYTKTYPVSQTAIGFSNLNTIDANVHVITFAAGFDIYFNQFSKRIYSQITLPVGNSMGIREPFFLNTDQPFIVYPNPACNYIKIESTGQIISPVDYRIIDIEGKEVLNGKMLPKTPIDIKSLPPGLFFITINSSQKQSQASCRVIKLQ